MSEPPILESERLTLRPCRAEDAEPLLAILADPAVSRWIGESDMARVRDELLVHGQVWTIVVDGEVAGWLNFEEETEWGFRSVGLDIFLAAHLHGRGLGPEALRLAIRHFIARDHHRFTIDPAIDNEHAIRAYESVGYKRVGVMRAYERHPGGDWHDNLLMDLLADELVDG